MVETASRSDLSVGLGLVFGLLAVGAAIATTVAGYTYAVEHAAGESATLFQLASGWGFGVAVLLASLAIVAIHVFE
ncbi:MAG: hypothetical protein ABEH35_08950 [Haloarculaceae archaeon]